MTTRSVRSVLVVVALSLVAIAGCSDDDGGGDGDASGSGGSTTTEAAGEATDEPAEPAGDAYSEPGEHPVGVTTLALPSGPEVEVWYPAAEDGGGEVSYDTRDFVPESVSALLTADIPAGYTFDGDRDVPASPDGPFPVVLFSHGFSGFRLQSSFLTSHLASHGFVVAAPDHPSRSLEGVLGGTASRDRASSVDELLETLDLVEGESARTGGLLEGAVDGEQVAALGHSAGGGTVFLAAADPRIDGYVSMASGAGGPDEESDPTYAEVPSFFLAGAIDEVVPPAEATRPAFEGAPSPTLYWEIEATGHNGFDDFCTFGNGTGVIGIAEQSGLGDLLDAQPELRALGEDGCIPPAAPVEEAFPIIRHGVTAWLRTLFEIDAEPVGLTADDLTVHELAVEVEES